MDAQPEIRVRLFLLVASMFQSLEDNDYLGTFDIFLTAQEAYDAYHRGPKPARGSVQSNMIEHTFSDIVVMAAEAMNLRVSARRSMSNSGSAGPCLLTREVGAADLTMALSLAHKSLAFSGVSDIQRFYGHYCRAIAYSNMGDFMTELDTIIPESEHAAMLADTVPNWNHALRCYKNAAQDAFYAVHLAAVSDLHTLPQDRIESMQTLRECMCDKLGYAAEWHFYEMYRAGLARLQLPILGLWEGDPALSEYWGPHKMTLMALYRRDDESYGPSDAVLKDAFAAHDIRWRHDGLGEIVLENTPEERMHPTWVVPDDTRAGLRDMTLESDTFNMALR